MLTSCPRPKCQARLFFARLALSISALDSQDEKVLTAVEAISRKGVA